MGLFQFLQKDTNLTSWFILDGREYEMSQFNISFGQSVDHKGQPQDEVRGGRILVGLRQTLPNSIYEWAMKSISKNGEIVFRSNTISSPLRIEFKNAYCINLNRNIINGEGVVTDLWISPDEILINGISFDNRWV